MCTRKESSAGQGEHHAKESELVDAQSLTFSARTLNKATAKIRQWLSQKQKHRYKAERAK
jgi:hypothetical protein